MSTWVSRCVAYYKLSVVQIIFLSTTNFTFPQALFYNINSLTDTFRCSQKCQIKLISCGLSLPAAEQILISQPLPARIQIPVWLRPAANMASRYHSSAGLSPTPSFQHTQNKRAKLQISMQMLLKLWQCSHIAVGEKEAHSFRRIKTKFNDIS